MKGATSMCTNLLMKRNSENDPIVSARTMDFPIKLETVVNLVPRGQRFPEIDLPEEIRWSNKYGFIGIGHPDKKLPGYFYTDGLNEVGLSAASLWLDGSEYEYPEPGYRDVLYHGNFVNYVLGNFCDVTQAKIELSKLSICEAPIKIVVNARTPLHFIIIDSRGDNLIVEFIDGNMKTYSNIGCSDTASLNRGILTNEPPYDWHITNLKNYADLSLVENKKEWAGNILFSSGQFGSPGDSSPVSRFIRAHLLTQSSCQPQNIQQSIVLAQDILQTIAVPAGTDIFDSSKNTYNWTLWSVIRDHTNRSIYFYTDFNSKLYGIHLDKLDFKAEDQKHCSIEFPDWYEDISDKWFR